MGKFEKAKERLKSIPNDYTYDEARSLLTHMGFREINKGKTSGSRVLFYRDRDERKICLHKPHPNKEMGLCNTQDLYDYLSGLGEL